MTANTPTAGQLAQLSDAEIDAIFTDAKLDRLLEEIDRNPPRRPAEDELAPFWTDYE